MYKFQANFIANAGIKDIVGRGLIYNDNIAIIELVKNSKDAGSPSVTIEFKESIDPLSKDVFSELIIADEGCGMTQEAIISKWLNIAFSEKQGAQKTYAGNKGVGRFSCDRLGTELTLYTKSTDGDYIKLPINWMLFENKGEKDEISTIPLEGETVSRKHFLQEVGKPSFKQGTILKIRHLRSEWPPNKLKKLISELEKFSPSLDQNFSVYLYSDKTYTEKKLQEKLNKKINNQILDKLAFQTTYLKSSIDIAGKHIETTLYFQGQYLYSYKAINPYKNLKNITTEIHYLDTLSKAYFTRNIGVSPNTYGSIFLFYNGFRVSPYGNEKNDWLGLDQRKSQGTTRNFGTREIFGRIDLTDKDSTFSVITSREGLAHNAAFLDLTSHDSEEKTLLTSGKRGYGFITMLIRQLENFVVSGLDWNRIIDTLGIKKTGVSAEDVKKDPNRYQIKAIDKELINAACDRILKSHLDISELDINHKLISEIQAVNDKKYSAFISDFVATTGDKSISELTPREKGVVKKIIHAEKFKKEAAIEERNLAEKQVEDTLGQLKVEKNKSLYLLSTRRTLSDDADGLIHTIKLNNIGISDAVDVLIEGINDNTFGQKEVIKRLGDIKLHSLKTLKMAELATRSGFNRDIDVRNIDLAKYIQEYADIYKETFGDNGIEVEFLIRSAPCIRSISVLNMSIIIDNLISNASKWGAGQIKFTFVNGKKNSLEIVISDNGYGLTEELLNNPESIFELGVRNEPPEEFEGSGIGLYYSRQLLLDMDASISFLGNGIELKGAAFKMVFN